VGQNYGAEYLMSLIDKMKTGIAAMLAGLPQTNTENHAAVTAGLGDALGGPVQESVDELNAQMAALNARMDGLAAENAAALAAAIAQLNTRIDNVPIYTPPSCLSYRITNSATDSNPSTDVQYTFKDCTGAVSAPITLFAGDSATVCADGLPKIVVGQSNARIDALGQSSCPPVGGMPTIGFITTPTIGISGQGGNTVPVSTPKPTPQIFSIIAVAAPVQGIRLDVGDLTGDFNPAVTVTIKGVTTPAQFPASINKTAVEGSTITFNATPQVRFAWRFVGWQDSNGTVLSTTTTYTTKVTGALTLIARYTRI